jgi:hypothetical protein
MKPAHGGLQARAQRALQLVGETRARSGSFAAAVLVARLVKGKLPMLWGNVLVAGRVKPARARIEAVREGAALGRPYLAIGFTGGIGDMIVVGRFLRDLDAHCGGIAFDVFCPAPKRAQWAFAGVPGFLGAYHDIMFDALRDDYDAAFRANQLLLVYAEDLNWNALKKYPALVQVIGRLVRKRDEIAVFADRHPFLDNFLAQKAVFAEASRRDYLHYLAGIAYGGDQIAMVADHASAARAGLAGKRYVTVHNGFDPGFIITTTRATKCYPHFGEVVAALKRARPDLTFVQIGAQTSAKLAECDVDLISKTTMPEVAGLLAGAVYHIDNESGLVHLARCLDTPAAVVFGPTPSNYFGYPDNLSIEPPVCGNCWWLTRAWMDSCAKGYAEPRCMTEQKPAVVAEAILADLAARGLGKGGFDRDRYPAQPETAEAVATMAAE